MKTYKVKDYKILIFTKAENFMKSDYAVDAIFKIRKKYDSNLYQIITRLYMNDTQQDNNSNYIVILKGTKMVGFLYGYYYMDLHIIRHVIHIKTSSDLHDIFKKLVKIFEMIQISVFIKEKPLINTLSKLGFHEWAFMKKKKHIFKNKRYIMLFNWTDPTTI